jgi:hypothetical protein
MHVRGRSLEPAEKLEQYEWLSPILVMATRRLQRLYEEKQTFSDLDFCNDIGVQCSPLDRHSRKALVYAVANSYHAATGRQIV